MDFAHFVGVTTFAPNMWRRTMYNYYKMIALVNNEKPAYIVY